MRISFANLTGRLEADGAMDVIIDDVFAGRFTARRVDGVHTLRLYDLNRDRELVASTSSRQGHTFSNDDSIKWVTAAARKHLLS